MDNRIDACQDMPENKGVSDKATKALKAPSKTNKKS
jgi:hypothetical protein